MRASLNPFQRAFGSRAAQDREAAVNAKFPFLRDT